jgi:hypothetical protein
MQYSIDTCHGSKKKGAIPTIDNAFDSPERLGCVDGEERVVTNARDNKFALSRLIDSSVLLNHMR